MESTITNSSVYHVAINDLNEKISLEEGQNQSGNEEYIEALKEQQKLLRSKIMYIQLEEFITTSPIYNLLSLSCQDEIKEIWIQQVRIIFDIGREIKAPSPFLISNTSSTSAPFSTLNSSSTYRPLQPTSFHDIDAQSNSSRNNDSYMQLSFRSKPK